MPRSTILSTVILTAAMTMALTLGPSNASAQQQRPVLPAPVEAPQVVWTPVYYYDDFGALWLVYVPTAPAQAAAPAPTARSPVGPRQRELGTGRNVPMHKPWAPKKR